jgi:hypothetical protein
VLTGRGATAATAGSDGGGGTGGGAFVDVEEEAVGSGKGCDDDVEGFGEIGIDCGLLVDETGSVDVDWEGDVMALGTGGSGGADKSGSEKEGGGRLVDDGADAEGSEGKGCCFLEEEDLAAVLVDEEEARPLLEEADAEGKEGSGTVEVEGSAAVDDNAKG